MAHRLTDIDQMFSVNELPWHGLGVIVDHALTAQEALDAANLDYEVKLWDLKATSELDGEIPLPEAYCTVARRQPLGIVGARYTIMQNRDAFKFMDSLTMDPNGPKYVTAGSLYGLRKVWLLAKMPDYFTVANGDRIDDYLLLSTSHDGTTGVYVRSTHVRVVCNNTLTMALSSEKGMRFKHLPYLTEAMDPAACREFMGLITKDRQSLRDFADLMCNWTPTEEQVNRALRKLFGEKRGKERAKTARYLSTNGAGNAEYAGTGWGLYNGIAETIDHQTKMRKTEEGSPAERKMDYTLYGVGHDKKVQAAQMLVGMATAGR